MNASELIDKQIADLAGWRGELSVRLRTLIREAAPGIKEEWKWNTAVWSHGGPVCAMGSLEESVECKPGSKE